MFVDSIDDGSHRDAVACSLIQHRLPDALFVGDALPDLTLQTVDGESSVKLRSFVGGVGPFGSIPRPPLLSLLP